MTKHKKKQLFTPFLDKCHTWPYEVGTGVNRLSTYHGVLRTPLSFDLQSVTIKICYVSISLRPTVARNGCQLWKTVLWEYNMVLVLKWFSGFNARPYVDGWRVPMTEFWKQAFNIISYYSLCKYIQSFMRINTSTHIIVIVRFSVMKMKLFRFKGCDLK